MHALLVKIEFVQVLTAPRHSGIQNRLYWLMSFATIALIPILVLLAVQHSFLRYQNNTITWLQRLCLLFDLGILIWFYMRLWFRRRGRQATLKAKLARLFLIGILPVFIIVINLSYAGIPTAETTTAGDVPSSRVREEVTGAFLSSGSSYRATQVAFIRAAQHPLDLGTCPWLGFGCRFLRVDHRVLLSSSISPDKLAQLRTDRAFDVPAGSVAFDGLSLRDRSLRFAYFEESILYGADLVRADLQGADLKRAQLSHANLTSAQLQRANLSDAKLREAVLKFAQLQNANLKNAQLQGADLLGARLDGAKLEGAQISTR